MSPPASAISRFPLAALSMAYYSLRHIRVGRKGLELNSYSQRTINRERKKRELHSKYVVQDSYCPHIHGLGRLGRVLCFNVEHKIQLSQNDTHGLQSLLASKDPTPYTYNSVRIRYRTFWKYIYLQGNLPHKNQPKRVLKASKSKKTLFYEWESRHSNSLSIVY